MAELISCGPLAGLDPVEAGGCTLDVLALGPVAAIQPWPGRAAAVDAALRARGLGFPQPGRSLEVADARILWVGREAAWLIGVAPPELADAAVTDISDGWAGLSLAGPAAGDVLARHVALDLRPGAFGEGAVAATLLEQVPCVILRRGGSFELLVPATLARSAWHALESAMQGVAARAAAG